MKLPPRRARYDTLLATGEDIRRGLEHRIDARDGDTGAAPGPPALAPSLRGREPESRGSVHCLAARPIRLVA